MTIFTKVMTTAIIISSAGLAGSAYAQDVQALSPSAAPAKAWLLKAVPENETRFQTLRTDRPSQQFTPLAASAQLTMWTDRELLVLTETAEEKYVKTDLSNFSYPVLGPIAFGVRPEPTEAAALNKAYQTAGIVSPSFGTNPFDRNTYREANASAAQLHVKF